MRRELNEFYESNPDSALMKLYLNLNLFIFKMRIRNIKLGSPRWHEMQEILSNKTSIKNHLKLRSVFYTNTLKSCGKDPIIHPNVILSFPKNIIFGNDIFINRGTFITAPVTVMIGDNCLIGPYCIINSGNHNYGSKDSLIRKQGHTELPIIIHEDVWIGAHVCILPGVTIGKGAVVGANSLVNRSVEPYTVVAGSPAREIKKRT